jgi:hypothetical protein
MMHKYRRRYDATSRQRYYAIFLSQLAMIQDLTSPRNADHLLRDARRACAIISRIPSSAYHCGS